MTFLSSFTLPFLLLHTTFSYLHNSTLLHIFVHHCTFCAPLHVKASPAGYQKRVMTGISNFSTYDEFKLLYSAECAIRAGGFDYSVVSVVYYHRILSLVKHLQGLAYYRPPLQLNRTAPLRFGEVLASLALQESITSLLRQQN